jgi:hypothetical protein
MHRRLNSFTSANILTESTRIKPKAVKGVEGARERDDEVVIACQRLICGMVTTFAEVWW